MLSNFYVPRPWHQVAPFSIAVFGLFIGHNLRPTYDVVLATITFYLMALICSIQLALLTAVYQSRLKMSNGSMPVTDVSDFEPIKPKTKTLPNLGLQYNSVTLNVQQRDPRWQTWATAVINGQPMTQTKWAGGGRMFSKPEYKSRMDKFLEDHVVVPKNSKSNNGSFRPNGAEGWEYIKALADGREWLPLPEKSE